MIWSVDSVRCSLIFSYWSETLLFQINLLHPLSELAQFSAVCLTAWPPSWHFFNVEDWEVSSCETVWSIGVSFGWMPSLVTHKIAWWVSNALTTNLTKQWLLTVCWLLGRWPARPSHQRYILAQLLVNYPHRTELNQNLSHVWKWATFENERPKFGMSLYLLKCGPNAKNTTSDVFLRLHNLTSERNLM